MKLVLLPGMDGTGDLFSDFIRALPSNVQVIAVCYPIDRMLSWLELDTLVRSTVAHMESFVLLAESFSTPVAIRYAASGFPNLKGLVLCAGFAASPVRGWKRSLARLIAGIARGKGIPAPIPERILLGSGASPSQRDQLRRTLARVPATILAARLRAVLACELRDELSRIAVPAMYLQARQDSLVSPLALAEMLRVKPDVRVVTLDGPHLLLQRKPIQCAEVVASFLLECAE